MQVIPSKNQQKLIGEDKYYYLEEVAENGIRTGLSWRK